MTVTLQPLPQLERDVQASDSNKQKAMFDMMLVKIKVLESQRRDGDTKNQQTKIERLQEKIQELETRNHYIIERARGDGQSQSLKYNVSLVLMQMVWRRFHRQQCFLLPSRCLQDITTLLLMLPKLMMIALSSCLEWGTAT